MRLISFASSAFLALVFLYAGLDKAAHYDGFVNAIGSYSLVPDWMAPGLAPVVICLEVVIGLGLLLPARRFQAALAGALTLAAFTAALAVNLIVAPGSVCGCWFSITLAQSDEAHIALNLILAVLALTLWWEGRNQTQGQRLLTSHRNGG